MRIKDYEYYDFLSVSPENKDLYRWPFYLPWYYYPNIKSITFQQGCNTFLTSILYVMKQSSKGFVFNTSLYFSLSFPVKDIS